MIYVSDLDGTLLNSEGKLNDFTVKNIKMLMDRGLKFTIASARSIFTAINFINELDLSIPIVLRNGAFIYDPFNRKVLMQKLLSHEQILPILDFFIDEGLNPIVHHASDEKLFVDYTRIDNYGERHYINSRLEAGDSRFRKVDGYTYDLDSEFISMCVIGENTIQDRVFKKAEKLFPEGYIIHKYVDTYSNHTWIEINHPEATKENAIAFILEYLGETEYTAFGDNINDIGMLESSSIAYMPENSYLAKAGYNYKKTKPIDDDGVIKKILEINSRL
ncbi:MAG: HAD-IIB family hydrolase [Clostridiales bacterium]|nr:HAD-IIB family hydrolase [Clostridiales bacterium]